MLKLHPYRIRTVEEALQEGYRQAPDFHAPVAEVLLDKIERIRGKIRWLRTLTPHRRRDYGPHLDPYRSILRHSFIVVDQEDYPEYMSKSGWDRYCFWSRDITRDN